MATEETFAVFILSHGRPDNVITYDTLRNRGYTGPIYIVIDNEDETAERYRELYGDQVVMFDKLAVSKTFDIADNFEGRAAVVYARNVCFDLAQELGIDYFLELDDDYLSFCYKYDHELNYREQPCYELDKLFEIVLDYYKSIPALTVALAQGGDFIGGENICGGKLSMKRKAMNTFFCSAERPFTFVGRMNEDVNTYTSEGNRGGLFLTLFNAMIHQVPTQLGAGGMTGLYAARGTYVKTFYAVMRCPSFVQVYETGVSQHRIHHRISWNEAVPKILREEHKTGGRNA